MSLKSWVAERKAKAMQREAERQAAIEASRRVHDFRNHTRGWGHDIGYRLLEGNRLDAWGWGHGLRVGDYVVLTNKATGGQPWYAVESVRYMSDPRDQFFAVLAWQPTVPAARKLALDQPAQSVLVKE